MRRFGREPGTLQAVERDMTCPRSYPAGLIQLVALSCFLVQSVLRRGTAAGAAGAAEVHDSSSEGPFREIRFTCAINTTAAAVCAPYVNHTPLL